MRINKTKRIQANEDIDVAPEATELLFEAEDVAQVVAEATGQDVAVDVTDEGVEFTVGEGEEADVIYVEPDGDEEVLESSTRSCKRSVKASTRAARPVARHAARTARTVRRTCR